VAAADANPVHALEKAHARMRKNRQLTVDDVFLTRRNLVKTRGLFDAPVIDWQRRDEVSDYLSESESDE